MNIEEKYFEEQKKTNKILAIYEPLTGLEWFFKNDKWQTFEKFNDEYKLLKEETHLFEGDSKVKKLSYKNYMLCLFSEHRKISIIEEDNVKLFIEKYEYAKKQNPLLTADEFAADLKKKEVEGLKTAERLANFFFGGCLTFILIGGMFFLLFVISRFKG